jgi:hypothetical protein
MVSIKALMTSQTLLDDCVEAYVSAATNTSMTAQSIVIGTSANSVMLVTNEVGSRFWIDSQVAFSSRLPDGFYISPNVLRDVQRLVERKNSFGLLL